MYGQIIGDDDVTWVKCGAKKSLHINKKHLANHGAVQHHRSSGRIDAQPCDKEPAPAKVGVVVLQCPC
jgi:hypothetical protein